MVHAIIFLNWSIEKLNLRQLTQHSTFLSTFLSSQTAVVKVDKSEIVLICSFLGLKMRAMLKLAEIISS
jgi:hypothetical protein